ncbi:TIGR01620 family protein [Idiomarina sp.]|uniref:TIGR01620 family protein n=1 Tax=Idiomarina sp. TaxID=1874361 RepID=UPI0025C51CC7|nr:TIGR01620 family protein [Idiomarina sp.]
MRQQSQQPKQGTAELEYLDPDDDAIKPVALEPTEVSEPLPSRPQKRRHLSRWLLLGMLLLLAAVTIESALLIVESFNQHWLLGVLWSGGLSILLLLLIIFVGREFLLLRKLKRRWRRDTQTAQPQQLLNELKHPDLAQAWQQLEQPYWNEQERAERFEKDILSRVDQQAQRIISKRAAETAALVAVSPSSVADMLLLLWRNQRMIADVAACYGVELGYWSRLRLWRQTLANLAYAGLSELAVDLGAQWLSAELMTKLSARAGQGLGAGLLTARLGYQAVNLTRPLPFHYTKRPGYARLQKDILTQLSQLLPGIYRRSKGTEKESQRAGETS